MSKVPYLSTMEKDNVSLEMEIALAEEKSPKALENSPKALDMSLRSLSTPSYVNVMVGGLSRHSLASSPVYMFCF